MIGENERQGVKIKASIKSIDIIRQCYHFAWNATKKSSKRGKTQENQRPLMRK